MLLLIFFRAMSTEPSKLLQFLKKNRLLVVMGSGLVGNHLFIFCLRKESITFFIRYIIYCRKKSSLKLSQGQKRRVFIAKGTKVCD